MPCSAQAGQIKRAMDKTLIEKYYKRNHLHRIGDQGPDDGVAIVPYCVMDIGYQFYTQDILPLDLHRGAKLARSRWAASQKAFMQELSSCYTPDEYESFLDLMDELTELTAKDVLVMRVQGMNCLSGHFDFEQQKVLSSALVSNYLALLSQNIWRITHTNADGSKNIENRNINGVQQWSREFSRHYMIDCGCSPDFVVADALVEQLDKSVDIVKRKVCKWIRDAML